MIDCIARQSFMAAPRSIPKKKQLYYGAYHKMLKNTGDAVILTYRCNAYCQMCHIYKYPSQRMVCKRCL